MHNKSDPCRTFAWNREGKKWTRYHNSLGIDGPLWFIKKSIKKSVNSWFGYFCARRQNWNCGILETVYSWDIGSNAFCRLAQSQIVRKSSGLNRSMRGRFIGWARILWPAVWALQYFGKCTLTDLPDWSNLDLFPTPNRNNPHDHFMIPYSLWKFSLRAILAFEGKWYY